MIWAKEGATRAAITTVGAELAHAAVDATVAAVIAHAVVIAPAPVGAFFVGRWWRRVCSACQVHVFTEVPVDVCLPESAPRRERTVAPKRRRSVCNRQRTDRVHGPDWADARLRSTR